FSLVIGKDSNYFSLHQFFSDLFCLLLTDGGKVILSQETNKATTMAVTLETELQSLMFSSQIPDIVIGTSDDNEVEVQSQTKGTVLLVTTC
ncbi:MAG: hypothetical protein SPK60_10435, partial [Sodaliphilus sp.]|nr:hypothetical protein [Bacteroidales bacterium]MDY5707321.1 hypothetical protein [Sodaliphilus sp.]